MTIIKYFHLYINKWYVNCLFCVPMGVKWMRGVLGGVLKVDKLYNTIRRQHFLLYSTFDSKKQRILMNNGGFGVGHITFNYTKY